MPRGPHLTVRRESWPIAGTFTISRGSKTAADVVVAELDDGETRGRGECVPYARYSETLDGVVAEIEKLRPQIEAGLTRAELQQALPAGAARNALDCAYWDLEAKRAGKPAWQLAGLAAPAPCVTAYTLSLDTPEKMESAAHAAAHRPLLKLKLGGEGDEARLRAVRRAAPEARLIVDANEGWSPQDLAAFAPLFEELNIALVEQPLPADADEALRDAAFPVPLCADEACHDRASLPQLVGKYDAINIKLDKTGGLTEAIALAREATGLGFDLMVGCMVGTSLAMAPAFLIARDAAFVDLDGPLLLAEDRPHGIRFDGSTMHPPPPGLWG